MNNSDMRQFYLFFLGILAIFFPVHNAYASTKVNYTNSVVVHSASNSSVNNETHVRIETNNEVKEFNTKGNESVHWQSEDGKSSVNITTSTTQPTVTQKSQSESEISVSQNDDSEDKKEVTHEQSIKASGKTTSLKQFSLFDLFEIIFSFFGFSKKNS